MKLLFILLGAVITSVAINWLVLPKDVSAQERELTMFGSVKGDSVPDGYAELAFNFYDKDRGVLAYRSISTAVVKDGTYTASLHANDLIEGKEYYVLVTLPNAVPEAPQGEQREAIGVVLLQSETPGIQQTGHVNISGTLIAGAIKTNAFQMSTGAGAGRVLTSDASGIGTWQALPPPSGAAEGDLSGSYPNPLVDGLQGKAVASTAPSSGQVLKWNGSAWSPDTDLRDAFWQPSGSNIFYTAGNVGIGTSNPSYPLSVETSVSNRAIQGVNTATSGGGYGVWGQSNSTSGRGVLGWASAATGNTYGMWGESSSTSGIGVLGWATAATGGTYGVWGQSNSTSGAGVLGWAPATSGSTYGVWGSSASTSGRGVYGSTSASSGATYGVYGQSASTSGGGVVGYTTATSGNTYGVLGRSDSTSGYGVYGYVSATSGYTSGGRFESASTSGVGVLGWATAASGTTYGAYGRSASTSGGGVLGLATAATGNTYGGWFESNSTDGRGVFGIATAATGYTFGGRFESDSTSGYGVFGFVSATSGTTYGVHGRSASTSGSGVYGVAIATSGTNYGVLGRAISPSGYGVYSEGDFAATGTKSFQIDHPLMPETHYLNHFCTEGPEPYNTYRGNVVTDAKGYATIILPPYFESINREPTYHLTVIDDSDDFVLAKVVQKIHNEQFVIRTSKPHVEVSWEVKAVRNDRWVQKCGFETEQEKLEEHKGKYLQPELYGMPKEYGIHYSPDVDRKERNERKLEARVSDSTLPSTSSSRRVPSQKPR
ncbi:MAG TPA: hypothetical protein VNK96_07045 [Fimbriimonadales bacterium]|nr:hypothetical protein [Fimbriimonadales bacterium]